MEVTFARKTFIILKKIIWCDMFIFNDTLLKIITFGFHGVQGITLCPFIIAKKNMKNNKRFINHERIHIQQSIEMLIIFFYLWYVIEFLIKFAIYKNWRAAYSLISFEKEAYRNQYNYEYIENRKPYSFINYLRGFI